MSKQRYEPIHEYITFEDLLQKAGYKQHRSRIGILGQAILKESKHNRSAKWLKEHLDAYFQRLRQKQKGKFKHNGKTKDGR